MESFPPPVGPHLPPPPQPPSGWYPDPWVSSDLRWWDGADWTHHTMAAVAAKAKPKKRGAFAAFVLLMVGMAMLAASLFPQFIPVEQGPLAPAWGSVTATDQAFPTGDIRGVKALHGGDRWDPCRSIPVRFTFRWGAPDVDRVGPAVNRAFSRLATVTGNRYVNEGVLATTAVQTRENNGFTTLAKPWEGITVIFADPDKPLAIGGSKLERNTQVGGITTIPAGDDSGRLSSAVVVIRPDNAGMANLEPLVLHELSHAMGLDHSDDRGSLMFPTYHGDNGEFTVQEANALHGLLGAGAGCIA